MNGGHCKMMACILVFVAFLSAATVMVGCGQESANTGSQEDSLKKLQELSSEGNEDKNKRETTTADQGKADQKKQE